MSIDLSRHSRGCFLAVLRVLLVSCLFLPTAGVTDQGTSGGETLESVVERRASGSGEMVLLTREAFLKAKEVGTKVFFENQSTETAIGGWTVVHLRDEDTTELIARYSKNIAVWSGTHIDRRLSSESRRLETWGGELAALGRMFENTCGQVPRLKLSKRVHVLAYQPKPVPVQEFCRAYMLILATNNIIVTYDPDGLPIAEELVGGPLPKSPRSSD